LTLQPLPGETQSKRRPVLGASSAWGQAMAEFTTDWFGRNTVYWAELFANQGWRADAPHTVIEIGSFEGRSALWILEHLLQHPQSRLHCVDTFHDRESPDSYWRRFERNVLQSAHAQKVSVTPSASMPFLSAFVAAGSKADFIYVDGSHRAAEVLEDLVLAFHATRVGGIIICDDYLKGAPSGDITLGSPKLAVDAFTTIYRDRIDIPWGQPLYQLAMIKTGDRPADDPGARGRRL
jgi:predicted O-methyltransferase YrrM